MSRDASEDFMEVIGKIAQFITNRILFDNPSAYFIEFPLEDIVPLLASKLNRHPSRMEEFARKSIRTLFLSI